MWKQQKVGSWAILLCCTVLFLSGCTSNTASAPVSNIWYQKNAANDYYRVRRGDTLYSIAWMFALDYRSLAAENSLVSPYSLSVGQKLKMTNVPIGEYKVRSVRSRYPSKQASHRQGRARGSQGRQWRRSSVASPKHWVWPAKGRIVQYFKKGYATNTGINISGHYAEPVCAAASGIVVYSGAGVRGYGNLIILKHNDSYLSAYAYNDKLLVSLGERVRAGQKIASMGRNDAGKTLLHFEIRKNGRPVDPMRFLRRQ